MTAAAMSGVGIANKALEVLDLMAGKNYIFGGKTTAGFDCSGFVTYVLRELHFPVGVAVHALNVDAYKTHRGFMDVDNPIAGDLIIFPKEEGKKDSFDHIGICLGASSFVGSQKSTGVAKASLGKGYWGDRSKVYRRPKEITIGSILATHSFDRRVA